MLKLEGNKMIMASFETQSVYLSDPVGLNQRCL
jgi:hypothetical protein